MKEELIKELEKRQNVLMGQAQLEMNKYHLDYLIGRIEEVESIIALIERLEEEIK